MREDLKKKEDAKIRILSLSISTGIYLLIVLAFWISGLLSYQELSDISSPVNIKIQSKGAAPVADIAPEPPKGTQAPQSTAETPKPQDNTEPQKPEPTQAKQPAKTAKATSAPASTPKPTQQEQPAVINGQENGSSYNIGLTASAGQVGRSFYVPIYLFMPLPDSLPQNIISYLRVKEAALDWDSIYTESGTDWLIKNQPPIEQRPQYWNALKKAGYNITKASYKNRSGLKTVKIEFKVDSSSKGSQLTDIKIISSSGYSDIDEAILYGFRQASFFNNTDKAIKGVFTYNF